jgi:hypothetical protein
VRRKTLDSKGRIVDQRCGLEYTYTFVLHNTFSVKRKCNVKGVTVKNLNHYTGVVVQVPSFLTSALDGGEGPVLCSGCFNPGKYPLVSIE